MRQRVRSTKGERHAAKGKEKKEMKVKEVKEWEREDRDERDGKKKKHVFRIKENIILMKMKIIFSWYRE